MPRPKKSKNQIRLDVGEKQVGRHVGTTRAKKPILKKEFQILIYSVKANKRIKSTSKPKLIRAFTLLYLTGCRISEIGKFSNNDIKEMIANNEYSLTNLTKTGLPRLISFDSNKMQIEYLKELLYENNKVLFNRNNSDEAMTTSGLTNLMNTFIHSALGQLYSTHSFRAGYVTAAHQLGLSLEHIREDIGHANIATTARYATVTHEEISRAKNMRAW